MPLYDFVCSECGKEFELLVLGREKPACPECGSEEVEKQVSRFAVGGGGGKGGGPSCSGCSGGNCASCG